MARPRPPPHPPTLPARGRAPAPPAPHSPARRDAIERDWAHHLRSVAATDQQLARFGIAARDIAAINGRLPVRCPPPEVVTTESAVDYGPLLAAAETLHESIATAITAGLTDAVVADLKGAMETLTGQCADAANATPPAEALAELQKSMASVTARWHIAERALALRAKANAILRRNVPNHDQSEPGTLATAGREIHRQRSATDRLLARYAWPDELPKPAELTALGQRQRELGEAAKRYTANVAALTAQVAAVLAELRDCLERGAAQDAVVVDRRLRELVKQLPDDEAPSFNAALADAGARLRELRAWRAYAETPKRQDLCQQMDQLATEPLEVNAQAETIKELRAQWNQLGAIDTRRDRELKQRFDQAAQRAFEPCRAHFKARAEQRTFNLEQRQTIVAALASYLADNDWEGADWRGVETVLREARAEWRRYHPVDRNAGRELSARFEELASRIHALLTEQRNQNLERKEAIVTAAVAIRESSDRATDKAVAMKALQQRWKAVGPAPRGPDKRLWTRFRAECDIVFEARNAVQDRHSQRRQAIAKTEALLAELERRVDVDPALNRNTVADYEGRLGDLESLPKELQRRVKSALENADRAAVSRQLRNAERVAPENPGRVAPEDPGRAAPENTERAASENPKRAASENPERAASENPKRAAPENPERAASENPERAASENPGRAAPENPERAASENPGRAAPENPGRA